MQCNDCYIILTKLSDVYEIYRYDKTILLAASQIHGFV